MKTYTAVGTRRRLQGLAVMAWPLSIVAQRTGLPLLALEAVADGEQRVTGDDIDVKVAQVYRKLLVSGRGPDEATAAYAKAEGWHSPAVWDDPDEDETPERAVVALNREQMIDPFAIEIALSSRDGRSLNRAERLEAARRLGMPNSPSSVVCAKLGLSTTVAKALQRDLLLDATRQAAPAA